MGFGAVWACRQGRVRGSLESLSGPSLGWEGQGNWRFTTSELRGGQSEGFAFSFVPPEFLRLGNSLCTSNCVDS